MAAQPGTISVDASSNTTLCARWFGAPFMPCFLGLAALRVWLQVNEFGGYAQSDNGIITILSNLTYGLTFLIAAAVAWRKPPHRAPSTPSPSLPQRSCWLPRC